MAALIAAPRDEHRIQPAVACQALGGSRCRFTRHQDDLMPARTARRALLAAQDRRLFFDTPRGTHGSPRITADFREAGSRVQVNASVARLMRQQRLAARRTKRRRSATQPGPGRLAGSLPRQAGTPGGQNQPRVTQQQNPDPHRSGQSFSSPRSWTSAHAGCSGSALGEHHDAALAYRALRHGGRGPQRPGCRRHHAHRPGRQLHPQHLPRGLSPARRRPVHGRARVRPGRRRHRNRRTRPWNSSFGRASRTSRPGAPARPSRPAWIEEYNATRRARPAA